MSRKSPRNLRGPEHPEAPARTPSGNQAGASSSRVERHRVAYNRAAAWSVLASIGHGVLAGLGLAGLILAMLVLTVVLLIVAMFVVVWWLGRSQLPTLPQ